MSKLYKLDWLTLIFSDVTSSYLNFADTFWNWRVQISNVIYWNIGPYLEIFVIKLIPRICCSSIFIFNYTFSMIFKSGLWAGHSMFLISFSSSECFCYASSMNRSIVIWEVPGNDWPQTTVQNFNIFCCIYYSINFSQSTDAIVCNATPNHDADFSVYTGTNTSLLSPNINSIVISNHNLALVRKQSPFSIHQMATVVFPCTTWLVFSCLPPEFVFSSCIRIDDTPCLE